MLPVSHILIFCIIYRIHQIDILLNAGGALKEKPLLDSYLEVYDGLCSLKKVADYKLY